MLKNAEGCCRISLFVGDMNISAGQENEKKKDRNLARKAKRVSNYSAPKRERDLMRDRDHSLQLQHLSDDLSSSRCRKCM